MTGYSTIRDKRLLLYLTLLGIVVMLALISVVATHILWPHFIWQYEPLHSTIETMGVVAAILMAIVLLQRQPNEGNRRLFWVAMGLLGGGILDGFHAVTQPGHGFVLLHSMAVLVAGFGFALVWLPESDRRPSLRKWVLWSVIAGSMLFGIWTLLFRDTLPAMVQDGQFTNTARVMNLLSGVFFIAAGARFLLDFHRSLKPELYLFACMALLFGLASLSFTFSALWDDVWWFWHVVRLLAYLLVMGFVVHGYLQTASSLRAETIGRKLADERISHLNLTLRAIRNVNQLISRENDRDRLLQGICHLLTEARGYHSAWIVLLDQSGKLRAHSEAGWGRDFAPMLERLRLGEIPVCGRQALGQASVVVTNKTTPTCAGCPLSDKLNDDGALTARLEHGGNIYGLLNASILRAFITDEETSLFKEAADDVAFALHDIALEAKRKEMEDALLAAEAKYQDLYDNAPIAYYSVGTDGFIKESNNALKLWLGYSKDEIRGMLFRDLYAEESRSKAESLFGRFKQGLDITNEEMVYRRKNGEKVYGLLSVSAVKDKSGQVVASRSVVKDITERKHLEQGIQESRNNLLEAQQIAHVGSWDWDVLTNLISYSDEFHRIFGQHVRNFETFLDSLHHNDRELVEKSVNEALREDKPYGIEYRIILPNGEERVIYAQGRVTFDNAGKPVRMIGTVQDITERKQAEYNLITLRQAIETSGEVIFLTDPEGIITYINPAFTRLYGYSRDELVGKTTPRILKGGTMKPEEYTSFWDTLMGRRVVKEEMVNKTKDGKLVTIEGSANAILDDNGDIIGFLSVQSDITERKKLQEQIMAQDRMASIGQLVAGVAHEINNPLTGVIGFSELLLQRELPDDIKDDLKVIYDEARRAAKIVKNLLTFARSQPERKAPIQINEQIQGVLALRDHEQKVNNIQVITRFASDLPQIIGNASQLQQVFFNIATNAEHAMLEAHKRGTLTITTEQSGDIIRISFADDGTGISTENMGKLFTPFFTTKGVGKGTGLGLSVCHGIITEHGGRIYAESEPGKGATFIVELPLQ